VKTLRLLTAMAAFSLAGPAASQTLPGGVLAGPLYPRPGSGSLYPGNGSLLPNSMPNQTGVPGFHRHHGFHGGIILYNEREVVHDVVAVHDQPPEPPPPPPPPRQRWVFGRSYGSLPGGCLKMLAAGGTFFDCSGEWYRQVGARQYRAVNAPL
jgi:hypothetical protein